jgi:maltose/moltooligosaccharide transporter
MHKPNLTFWRTWNMNIGFLGIQFGWGLQMANMSAIYEYLGAKPDQIPMLWLAAPLTGLIVQPIIGHMSDRTWGRLGRRRPYFLTGAILSSIALVLMPNSSALWMAAGLLWILDASINISMEPFRAFVADMLPEEQRTRGFAMQGLFIGLGATIASALPWIMARLLSAEALAGGGTIPMAVKLSFYLGAAVFFSAVLWTILSTREYPPDDMEAFRRMKAEKGGLATNGKEIFRMIGRMSATMRQLAWVQVSTWMGLFCMWLYFPVAVARNVFGAPDERSPVYAEGIAWAGMCFGMYSVVCFFYSLALPAIARRVGRKTTHSLSLLCGAAGLLSVGLIHNPYLLLLSMSGVGIAWASTVAMPYAILAGSVPADKTGIYMGFFNFFIVLPEICASLGFGWVMGHVLGNNRLAAVLIGGVFLILAAALVYRVDDVAASHRAAKPYAPDAR